jgi:hypothetical protein
MLRADLVPRRLMVAKGLVIQIAIVALGRLVLVELAFLSITVHKSDGVVHRRSKVPDFIDTYWIFQGISEFIVDTIFLIHSRVRVLDIMLPVFLLVCESYHLAHVKNIKAWVVVYSRV